MIDLSPWPVLTGMCLLLCAQIKWRTNDVYGPDPVRSVMFTSFGRQKSISEIVTGLLCLAMFSLVATAPQQHLDLFCAIFGLYLSIGSGILLLRHAHHAPVVSRGSNPSYQVVCRSLLWPWFISGAVARGVRARISPSR